MHSELTAIDDLGANTLSPSVNVEEVSLDAYVTFICNTNAKTFVGLGNGTVQCYSASSLSNNSDTLNIRESQQLSSLRKHGFSVRGLPICAATVMGEDSVLVGTDNSELLNIGDDLQTNVALEKGWIEHVALSESGLIAYAVNKTCFVLTKSGEFHEIVQSAGSITGLHFNSNGSKLAIARYGGVAIWSASQEKIIEELEQPGAHLNLSWSPDDKYLVTATPDKEIHCWEMKTRTSFRMRGYPAKIRSLCWTADGMHLAAAGADSVTVWPFVNGNPSGKPPYEFGYSFKGTVTEVAAHPTEDIVAAGYDNGTVLIGKYLKGEAIIARVPSGEMVSAMAWSPGGESLFVGTEAGSFSRIVLKDTNF